MAFLWQCCEIVHKSWKKQVLSKNTQSTFNTIKVNMDLHENGGQNMKKKFTKKEKSKVICLKFLIPPKFSMTGTLPNKI